MLSRRERGRNASGQIRRGEVGDTAHEAQTLVTIVLRAAWRRRAARTTDSSLHKNHRLCRTDTGR